jgi:hypothetical protein
MPEKETLERANEDLREGKAPSTAAGEFVREEIDHVREGKHGVRSPQQAIAIGLSKARRAGVPLPPPRGGKASTRKKAERDYETGRAGRSGGGASGKTAGLKSAAKKKSTRRSKAREEVLKREPKSTASRAALSKQAKSAAKKRGASSRKAAAKKAVRTKGKAELRSAADEQGLFGRPSGRG